MHCTRPPLLAREVMSLLVFWVTGKAALDLRPVNGATMLAWAGVARLTGATIAEESIEEAISFFLLYFSKSFARVAKLLLSLPIYNGINWMVHILWSQIDGLNFKQNLTIGSYTWWHYTIMATWKRKFFWI